MMKMIRMNDNLGVYVLLSHLLITLAIIGVYAYTLFTGQGDETLKTILTVIIGYWFGSIGVNSLKSAEKITENVVNTQNDQSKDIK